MRIMTGFLVRRRFQRSSGFDDGSYPDPIVGNAWPCWNGIVVSG